MNSKSNPALAEWHRILYDWEYLMDIPSLHRADLKKRADELLRDGSIDELEHWDMCTLAMAAEAHAIESKIDDFLQPSQQYDLVNDDGGYGGYTDGYAIYFDGSMSIADRGVCRRGQHHFRVLTFGQYPEGELIHDRLIVPGKPPCRLVLRSRRVNGVIVPV